MPESTYYVASLKNPGHALSTYIMGELVDDGATVLTLRNVVKVMESPVREGGLGYNFMTDPFFTVNANVTIDRVHILMGRKLDPSIDQEMLLKISSLLANIRVKKSGLVIPNLDVSSLKKEVMNNGNRG